jgi:hypothetical protein
MVAFWEPKAGSPPRDWEDGVAYSADCGRFALADGASTGSRSREWAYTLVSSAFCPVTRLDLVAASTDLFCRWMASVRNSFDPEVHQFAAASAPGWVRETSRPTGSFATFLAGEIGADDRLSVVSVGDCCLFILTAEGDIRTFPATSPSDFDSTPELLASSEEAHIPEPRWFSTRLAATDRLFAATDALSAELNSVTSIGFQRLISDRRHRRLIKNDDVTLLRVGEA